MKKTDTYHHGHLRKALLESARSLVMDEGVEALTLREVARRAGVSTAAPYHHFASKAELIHVLTQHSLEDLDRVSQEALHGKIDPYEKLQAIGVAYVMYAVEHSAEFRLVFRPEKGSPREWSDTSEALVYRVLLAVVEECIAAGVVKGPAEAAAITAWSLVHGLAALLVDGPLHAMTADHDAVRAFAQEITRKLRIA